MSIKKLANGYVINKKYVSNEKLLSILFKYLKSKNMDIYHIENLLKNLKKAV